MEKHTIMDGKVHVYKRDRSKYWQCSTYLSGKNRRASTKQELLTDAKHFAEDWYYGLIGQHRSGLLKDGHPFMKAAQEFSREYPVMTEGQRNPNYVQDHMGRIRNHLEPFFGKMNIPVSHPSITSSRRLFLSNQITLTAPTSNCLMRSIQSHLSGKKGSLGNCEPFCFCH